MLWLLCTSKVKDYDRWRQIFNSNAEEHRAAGLKLMREDGWVKVRKGISTVEEIVRVTKIDAAALGQ